MPPASVISLSAYHSPACSPEDGEWRIAAFHNTKRKPLLEAISFRAAPGLVPPPGSDPPSLLTMKRLPTAESLRDHP
ncbi:hypothetical protein GCM10009647_054260 [Streptomyces sanglieri]|uniref:Uncharacterized protein n=1 Tax=Streptomyces sanglieri TaxID=193460 RepID=A0ABW2XA62_9ACTN|nr:hypothetical protein [Streptomyces sp. Wh19]MDV9194696.1 hypothetical protein [Streptomyces sp. Wh19]